MCCKIVEFDILLCARAKERSGLVRSAWSVLFGVSVDGIGMSCFLGFKGIARQDER